MDSLRLRELFVLDPIEKFFRERRTLFLYNDVDIPIVQDISERLIWLDAQSSKEPITIHIASPGGETAAGFALVDVMELIEAPIHTIGRGLVASAALQIFMTGTRRVLYRRATVLSHRFSGAEFGDQADLAASAGENLRVHRRMIDHYLRYTVLKNKAEVEEFLLRESDVYLSPEEVLRFGLCDEIAGTESKHVKLERSAAFRRWLGAKRKRKGS